MAPTQTGSTMAQVYATLLLLLLVSSGPVSAQTDPIPMPTAPDVGARAFILTDHDSGQLLGERLADERMEPASITKLMTAYVVDVALRDGDIQADDMVTISEKAWRTEGSRMFIEVGKQVSLEDLMKGLVIQSGNDAAVALAEHVAGSEQAFAALMNHHAEQLGLSNTHFMNATGLPHPDHYMSARDIANLSRAVIREFPGHYALYAEKEYTYNKIRQYNRNQLLWRDESVDGLKTGHTESAGYCLAASALRGDQRLISVVLGAPDEKGRTSASQTLLNYGFRFFKTHKLYDAEQPLTQTRVWKGDRSELGLGLAETLYITVPRGRYKDLQASMVIKPQIEAPVAAGAEMGRVNVVLDDETLADVPLIALSQVAEGGLFGRLTDQAIMTFQSLFD